MSKDELIAALRKQSRQRPDGSDVVLQDRGSRRLKGVEGDWELFGVVGR